VGLDKDVVDCWEQLAPEERSDDASGAALPCSREACFYLGSVRRMGNKHFGFISSRALLVPFGIDDIFFHTRHCSDYVRKGDQVRFLVMTPPRSDKPNSSKLFAIQVQPARRGDAVPLAKQVELRR